MLMLLGPGTIRGRLARPLAALALAGALLACANTPEAEAYEPRVPEEFYGINAPELLPMHWQDPAGAAKHMAKMQSIGLRWVRGDAFWASAEPVPPVGDVHVYSWSFLDGYVAALARAGLTMVPIPDGTPVWARSTAAVTAGCGSRSAPDASRANDYRAYVKALVERYGREGTFWAQNPNLPYRPVTTVELWNEPNWAGVWCPGPDPDAYARFAAAGADGAHAADPDVDVAMGGLVTIREDLYRDGRLHGMAPDRFLDRAVAAEPGLPQKLDSVGIHLYDADTDVNLSLIGWMRARLADSGFDAAELLITEFGWHTRGGSDAVSEEERVANYRTVVGQFSRTDCRVAGIASHNWVSRETEPSDPEEWFGIAKRATTELYPAGQAYADEIARYRGAGPEPPPRDTLSICGGPPPDQDDDGVADEVDDYPLDPARSTGSGEQPPPDDDQAPAPPMAPRLPDSFFGVSVRGMPWEAHLRRSYYDSMNAAHLGTVRDGTLWSHAEPKSPGDPDHKFSWSETDPRVLGLAKRGMRVQPSFVKVPGWVPRTQAEGSAAFASFLAAYAQRYGRGGSFWRENGHLDESLAPRDFEVWSEVNVRGNAWDGSASPAEYAETYARARDALRGVDPQARAIVPLNEFGSAGDAEAFISGMVAARPSLAGAIDGVYVQSLQPSSAGHLELMLGRVRRALDQSGNGGASIAVGYGWYTSGPNAVSEAARADLYRQVTDRLARTDCGVEGLFADAWTGPEKDATNPWEWLGIAHSADGALKPSGEAFAGAAEPYLGFGSQPAKRETVHACAKGDPDRDGDGVADPVDDFPLDAERSDGIGPEVSIAGPEGGRRVRQRARFSLGAEDPSGVGGLECQFDGRAFAACDASYVTGRLKAGRHTLRVQVADSEGNLALAKRSWRTRR